MSFFSTSSVDKLDFSTDSSYLNWSAETTIACYHEPKVHDHQLYFQLTRIKLLVLLPLALLGLVSNACALFCLCTPPKISSGVFIYLKALLILDHVHILMSLANCLLPDLCDAHHSREHTFYRFCMFEQRFLRLLVPRLDQTISTLHVWTIASLSAHRYWKISRPVVSRFKDTIKRARLMLTILFLVIFAYRLPIFVVELQWKWNPVFRIQKRQETTELLSPYRVALYSIVDPIVSNFVPFTLMCVFSLLTLCDILKSRQFTSYAQFSVDSQGSTSGGAVANGGYHHNYPQKHKWSGDSAGNQPTITLEMTTWLRTRRANGVRLKQEYRATISIVLMILLYLLLHSIELYILGRKWQLLLQQKCPTKTDYIQSQMSRIFSLISASVNAFVFIAFTNRMRTYIQMLIRKTSRTLSSHCSDPHLHHYPPQSATKMMIASKLNHNEKVDFV